MAQDTSAPRTTGAGPDLGSGEQESTADPSRTGNEVGGAPLERLLSVVVLSPAQASLLAVHLLDATSISGTGNGTQPANAGLWTMAITASGDVDVRRARPGEGARVTELLGQLSQSARRLPAHPRSEQLLLLGRLEEAAADPRLEPVARAREIERALVEVLGPDAPQRLAGQLAALVGAWTHIAPGVAVPVDALAAPGGSGAEPHRAPPTTSVPSRPPRYGRTLRRRHTRTRRVALAVLLLTTALAGSGYVVLRDPDGGIAGAFGRDRSPTAPTTTGPSDSSKEPGKDARPRPRAGVETLAGRHAGPITGVEVQKAAGCAPGALCPVTVTVRFRPATTTRAIAWKVGAARLCTSGITWSPPISVTAQPGWTSVYASSSVRVPPGRSLALVALTTAPARAQSPPVPVTGSALRC